MSPLEMRRSRIEDPAPRQSCWQQQAALALSYRPAAGAPPTSTVWTWSESCRLSVPGVRTSAISLFARTRRTFAHSSRPITAGHRPPRRRPGVQPGLARGPSTTRTTTAPAESLSGRRCRVRRGEPPASRRVRQRRQAPRSPLPERSRRRRDLQWAMYAQQEQPQRFRPLPEPDSRPLSPLRPTLN